jgi:hypothetical protein
MAGYGYQAVGARDTRPEKPQAVVSLDDPFKIIDCVEKVLSQIEEKILLRQTARSERPR